MEEDELVLSDVHLHTHHCSQPSSLLLNNYKVFISRFVFLQPGCTGSVPSSNEHSVDEDGDLIVQRKTGTGNTPYTSDVIRIEHALSTRLQDVGLQVWQGCLLLCDYILDNKCVFDGVVALELGSGVGLAAICVAMYAQTVFCTDYGDDILETCRRNAIHNCADNGKIVRVRELNWLSWQPHSCDMGSSRFGWSTADLEKLNEVTVLLAADVVYDDELTNAFFDTVSRLMSKPPSKTLYMTVEKRLNFRLEDLDVACAAYDNFLACVTRLCTSDDSGGVNFRAQRLQTSFTQYFQYDRTAQLELWKITVEF